MTSFNAISRRLEDLAIEVPSWAYGNSGTRFKVFGTPGTPRTVEEKIADAAAVHRFTGLAPVGRAAHPVGPGRRLRRPAGVRRGPGRAPRHDQQQHLPGRRLQARQPHQRRPEGPAEGGRAQPRVHRRDGPDRLARPQDLARRRHQLPRPGRHPRPPGLAGRGARRRSTRQLGDDQRLVLEYKFFEPAFYHTDVPDWGTSYAHVAALGDKAMVCLDTGHHAPGTNIEFIVAQLLRLGKLGSFDFNSRFYADDDLIVGAADPFQLFRIMVEVVRGGGFGAGQRRRADARPVPQHRGQDPRPDPLGAQRAGDDRARAAARHRGARRGADRAATCSRANEIFMDAFYTDVRRDLAAWREERGPARRPHAGLPQQWIPGRDRGRPRRRLAGRMELTVSNAQPTTAGADRAVQPPRRRPAQHQLRRRQHLRQGQPSPTR